MTLRIPESFPCPSVSTGLPAFGERTAAAFAGGGFRGVDGGVSGEMGFHRLHGDESTPMTAGATMIGKAVIKPPTGPAAGGDPGG